MVAIATTMSSSFFHSLLTNNKHRAVGLCFQVLVCDVAHRLGMHKTCAHAHAHVLNPSPESPRDPNTP